MGLYNLIFKNINSFDDYYGAVNDVCRSDCINTVSHELAKKCYEIYNSATTLEEKLLAIRVPVEISKNYGMIHSFYVNCKYNIIDDKTHKTVYVRMKYKRGNRTILKNLEITFEKVRLVKKFKPKIEMSFNLWSE